MPTARRTQIVLAGLFLAGAVIQFYLAGRGAFGAGGYEPHQNVGRVLQTVALLVFVAALCFEQTRNRVDLGLAGALLLLTGLQTALANADGEVGALHGLNALLVTGAAAGILARNRRLGRPH